MATVHVMDGNGQNYTLIIHAPIPAGSTLGGFLWSDIAKKVGRNTSRLTPVPGPTLGPGEILQSELDQIELGMILEDIIPYTDTGGSSGQRAADLDARAPDMVAAVVNNFKTTYKFYGITRP